MRQLAAGHVPGAHRSRRGDSGLEFRGHVALADAGDLRRIDLHASVRDPLGLHSGNWQVKVFSERKAVSVVVVADLSASMGFEGRRRRLDVLADFTAATARSAWRHGDAFGFVGCDDEVRAAWTLPPTRQRGAGEALAARLRALEPAGGAGGLRQAAASLPVRRSLVFLVSDFHAPLDSIDASLGALAAHELVPVVLWDAEEFAPPADGIAYLVDAESGARRMVWMRPALRERWHAARVERRAALHALFDRHRLDPLELFDGYRADAVTAHFV
ncbi:MAG TPA: DUF58 domain-containing protein [Methylibium sp.]|uniref:DUF58 domain-containing protein n=1 Tax=Methylibium sp. TaxID=2067992 RepID=UPI002DBDD67F|nr:DUF58 domain-containing protein [Methylibium sp.]HEU4460089.1 DUF58 domain-containing protein [Methylibium sp.]